MKVRLAALFALLIVGGLTIPVSARDVKVQVPGFKQMSKEDQDKVIRDISRKNKLKPGEDKITIEDPKAGGIEIICQLIGGC